MSAYAETMWNHANVDVALDHIKPMGDCVLVRVLPEEEILRSGIVIPHTSKDSSVPRIGEVIAVGPGDKRHMWWCDFCHGARRTTTKAPGKCVCGKTAWFYGGHDRHDMHVKPGDRVYYWRTLANEHVINGELFQFLREEQHILGVLEN